MKLSEKQIGKIIKNIKINLNLSIVMVDVSDKKDGWSIDESNFNIYCVGQHYEIIWIIKELQSKPVSIFGEADPFVYLGLENNNTITAGRYSGFEYKIDPETGEAIKIGFHK